MTRKDDRRRRDAVWLRDDFDDDPFAKESRRRAGDRKTAQLCSQAQRALTGALGAELNDPQIADLVLAEVRPHPNASHLLAVVWAPQGCDLGMLEDRLHRSGGHFRALLGRAISRKRVPMLSFLVLPEGGEYDE